MEMKIKRITEFEGEIIEEGPEMYQDCHGEWCGDTVDSEYCYRAVETQELYWADEKNTLIKLSDVHAEKIYSHFLSEEYDKIDNIELLEIGINL